MDMNIADSACMTEITVYRFGKPYFHFASTRKLSFQELESVRKEGLTGAEESECEIKIKINGRVWKRGE